jgi:hypothetical protein
MSKTETSHAVTPDEPGHAADDHGEPDGHAGSGDHDDHGHGGEALGPVDVRAWGALALGVAAGLVVALCLVITTTFLAAATPV